MHAHFVAENEARMMALPRPPTTWSGRVHHVVQERFGTEAPSLHGQSIADSLDVSLRSLQRHLREEGTSLREIVQRLQVEESIRRLRKGSTVADVAIGVGYADASAFHRAFVRLTGRRPSNA